MSWVAVAIGGIAVTAGTGIYSASATRAAGRDAAESAEAQTDAAIQFQREQREDIQRSISNFGYSFTPENPYRDLTNHLENVDNQFQNIDNYYNNVDNSYLELENTFNNIDNSYGDLENQYSDLTNQYEGLQSAFQNVENSFLNVSNPFSGQQISQRDIDFRQKQANQQLANVLDSVRESGATAASATALARQAGLNTDQLGGEIERRETANIQQFNQAEFQRQQLVAQGQQQVDFARAGAQDRFSELRAQGAQQLQFAQAGEQSRLDSLAAQGEQQLAFARAGQEFGIQQSIAGEQSRLDTLVAQQNQANDLRERESEQGRTLAIAQENSRLDQLEREGNVYVDSILRERDANALDAALAGYNLNAPRGQSTHGGRNQYVPRPQQQFQNQIPSYINQIQQNGYNYGGYNSNTGQPVYGPRGQEDFRLYDGNPEDGSYDSFRNQYNNNIY